MEPPSGKFVPRAPSPNPFPEKYRRPCPALHKTCVRSASMPLITQGAYNLRFFPGRGASQPTHISPHPLDPYPPTLGSQREPG